jgi:prepilin-type N-terminal cleavage/methylation domain-containing protein
MRRERGGQHGFTLIEVLVSLTIFSVIALAVYSTFAAGVGAWRRAQEFSATYQTARLVLDDMAQELTNAVSLAGTDFVGEPQRISLLTVRRHPYAQGRPADPRITRVTYEVRRDRASATYSLARVEASAVPGSREGETEVVVSPISRLEFQYTHRDDKGQIVPWKDAWRVSDAVPLGVKIVLVVGETRFTKLVFIPHGFQESATGSPRE